ncbi:VOC family protein [Reichenbachiella agariperforans]|uniref:Lactoylglutathione lyase n=1 Tax=Reichenbachiella agariperforans TaxID=156994 RepID=A0A1M6K163_REIAG|nr:VOC family protein [Reichenbachiella agariperforans]SHJ52582.1 lactoylglutathione lyase [Reichenbachiella agariperforans]
MIKVEHVAIWVKDLEKTRLFYEQYFGATSNQKYVNTTKGFSSYFLSWPEGARLELMSREDVKGDYIGERLGWAHLALSVGGKETVDQLTEQLRIDGYTVVGEPRTTGDGYYESVVLDPEGNRIEITK